MKKLEKWSHRWIEIANLLDVPSTVVSTITVLTSHTGDKNPLYKVIEWWFINTANPEWTVIDQLSCK